MIGNPQQRSLLDQADAAEAATGPRLKPGVRQPQAKSLLDSADQEEYSTRLNRVNERFAQKWKRPITVSGLDTPAHRKGNRENYTSDVRTHDLTPEQRRDLVDFGRQEGVKFDDYTDTWKQHGFTGPHMHGQMSENAPEPQSQPTAVAAPSQTDDPVDSGFNFGPTSLRPTGSKRVLRAQSPAVVQASPSAQHAPITPQRNSSSITNPITTPLAIAHPQPIGKPISDTEQGLQGAFEDAKRRGDLDKAGEYGGRLKNEFGWSMRYDRSGNTNWPSIIPPAGANAGTSADPLYGERQGTEKFVEEHARRSEPTKSSSWSKGRRVGGVTLPEPIVQGAADFAVGAVNPLVRAVQGVSRLPGAAADELRRIPMGTDPTQTPTQTGESSEPQIRASYESNPVEHWLGDASMSVEEFAHANGLPVGTAKELVTAAGGLVPLLLLKRPLAIGALTAAETYGRGESLGASLEAGAEQAAVIGAMGGGAKLLDEAVGTPGLYKSLRGAGVTKESARPAAIAAGSGGRLVGRTAVNVTAPNAVRVATGQEPHPITPAEAVMGAGFALAHGMGRPDSEASRRTPAGSPEAAATPDVSRGQSPSELVPEPAGAIDAQLQTLRRQLGSRRVVLVPKDSEMPMSRSQLENAGFAVTIPKDTAGNPIAGTFIHYVDPKRPNSISRQEVRRMAANGTYGQLLGNLEPKSPAATEVVVAQDESGTAPAQAAELQAQHPQARVDIEMPEDVITGRQAARGEEPVSEQDREMLKQKSMRGERFTPAENVLADRVQREFQARRNLPADEAARLPEREWQDWVGSRVPSEVLGNEAVTVADEAHRATVLRGDLEGAKMIRKRISFLATEDEDGTPLPRNAESNKRTERVLAEMKAREAQARPAQSPQVRANAPIARRLEPETKTPTLMDRADQLEARVGRELEPVVEANGGSAKPQVPQGQAPPERVEPDQHHSAYQPRDDSGHFAGEPEYPKQDVRGAASRREANYDRLVALRRGSEESLYQASNLTTEETDRVRAKFEALKKEGRPIKTAVDDYLKQGGLFGSELNPDQQELLRDLASPARRAPVKAEQGGLFGDTSPTVESRREQSQIERAGRTIKGGLFQSDDSDAHRLISEVIDDLVSEGVTTFKEAAEKFREEFGPAEEYGDIFQEAWDANKNVKKRGKATFDSAIEEPQPEKRETLTNAVIRNGRLKSTGFSGKGEKRMLSVKEGGRLGLFSDKGVRPEDMMGILEGEGFNFDGDLNKFNDALRDEIGGKSHYSDAGASEAGEAAAEREWDRQRHEEFAQNSDHSVMARAFDNPDDKAHAPWLESFDEIRHSKLEPHPDDVEYFKEVSRDLGLSDETINRIIGSGQDARREDKVRSESISAATRRTSTVPTDSTSFKQGLVDHFRYSDEAAEATTATTDAALTTLENWGGPKKEDSYKSIWLTHGGKGEGLEQGDSQRIGIFNKEGKLVGTASLSEKSDPAKWVEQNYGKGYDFGPLTMNNGLEQAAWHGSPYHFDKFTLEHIGKGEGAQAYGWGLYFAGNEDVARYYKDRLKPQRGLINAARQHIKPDYDSPDFRDKLKAHVEEYAPVMSAGKKVSDFVDYAVDSYKRGASPNLHTSPFGDNRIAGKKRAWDSEADTIYRFLDSYREDFYERAGQNARLYRVDLKPEESDYLLWDKPLSEQSEKVKAALDSLLNEYRQTEGGHGPYFSDSMTGEGIYKELRRQAAIGEDSTNRVLRGRGQALVAPTAARRTSEQLASLGIRGIKYLDGSSRSRGEGNHNYVIFDAVDIAIEEALRQGAHGMTQFLKTGEAVIRALKNPNESTAIHEIHHWAVVQFMDLAEKLRTDPAYLESLDRTLRRATSEGAEPQLVKDMRNMSRWMGFENAEHFMDSHGRYVDGTLKGRDLKRYIDGQEKGARGFEKYMRTSKAPTPALEAIFAKFKDWLTNIYQNVKGSPIDIDFTQQQIAIWDRMLGGKGEEGPKVTGIKNATVNEERVARGRDPIEQELRRAWPGVYEEGKALVDGNRHFLEETVMGLIENPRTPSDAENAALGYHRMTLHNEHREALREMGDAVERDDGSGVFDAERKLKKIEEEIVLSDQAAKVSGTEWGRSGNARKMMIREDYSMATMVSKAIVAAKESGKKLSPELEEEIRTMANRITDLNSQLDAREKYITELESQRAREEKTQNWRAAGRKGPRRPKAALDADFAKMEDELARLTGARGVGRAGEEGAAPAQQALYQAAKISDHSGPFTPELEKLIKDMARNRVEAGARTGEEVNAEVHAVIRQYLPEVEAREVGDVWSEYGKRAKLSKDEIDVAYREAKRQQRLLAALDDAEAGIAPSRSGLQPDKQTSRVRELKKQVSAAMRKMGIQDQRSPEERWATALEGIKTRWRNGIADADRQIETGERPAKRVSTPLDDEARTLKVQFDERKKVLREIEGPRRLTEQERIEMSEAGLERSIKDLDVRIERGQLSPVRRASSPWSPRIGDLQAQRKVRVEMLKELRDAAKPPRDKDAERLKAFKKAVEKSTNEYQRRLDEGDFTTTTRKPLEKDAIAKDLEQKRDLVKRQYQNRLEAMRPGKWFRNISGLRKAWMLSGLSTQGRNSLGTAGYQVFDEVARMPAVIADVAVSGITGQRSIQGLSPVAALDSMIAMYKVGGKEAKEILRHGATAEQMKTLQFGQEIALGKGWGEGSNPAAVGLNSGLKVIEVASNAVFRVMSASDRLFYNYALKRNLIDRATVQAKNEARTDKGLDVRQRAKDLVDNPSAEMNASAIHDALVATFNNNNTMSTKIKAFRAVADPRPGESKAARERRNAALNFALDMVLPFDRTPTNVIARILEASPYGFARNTKQIARAVVNQGMTVEQQRDFSRTFGRATTGSTLMALGFYLAARGLLTGAPSPDQAERKDQMEEGVEFNSLKVGENWVDVGSVSPVGNLLTIGAGIYHESHRDKGTGWDVFGAAAKPLLDQPLLRGVSQVSDLFADPERTAPKAIARFAGSFIPFSGALRDVAKVTDKAARRYADPKSIKEQVQQNIPVMRELLPEGKPSSRGSAAFSTGAPKGKGTPAVGRR